ncbi:hypothetical protein J5N97_007676 [Dioscorea zingiberensis]|uniref:WRKY domain-containing protein n=1 Tax=Dioscorea zingiberensis TaxID=325984 RepID=A0A9D5DER1_9LILI|nr:hypothetical protein J5N97_007676 [Dioscorea zingiberensis]
MDMCSAATWDPNLLVELLTAGEEQIRQLEANLAEQSSFEICKALAHEIESTFKKAISMAKLGESPVCSNAITATNITNPDSPRSTNGSPRSETSDRVFKDQERREMTKKRKTLPRWSNQVRVSSGAGAEAPLDDGYSWRKYGQKDILGAVYPRGYYRCTHRITKGCLATKQVQRSDMDPTIFDVIYRGEHTCFLEKPMAAAPAPASQQTTGIQQNQQQHVAGEHQQPQQQDNQLLLSFQTNLKVKTEGLNMEEHDQKSTSFSFPSTPIGSLQPRNNFFTSPARMDNYFIDSFSPAFLSPTTSESNYFSVSPCGKSNPSTAFSYHHTAESEFTEIISTVTSATNSPIVDIDFMLEPGEFDAFDPISFFP